MARVVLLVGVGAGVGAVLVGFGVVLVLGVWMMPFVAAIVGVGVAVGFALPVLVNDLQNAVAELA